MMDISRFFRPTPIGLVVDVRYLVCNSWPKITICISHIHRPTPIGLVDVRYLVCVTLGQKITRWIYRTSTDRFRSAWSMRAHRMHRFVHRLILFVYKDHSIGPDAPHRIPRMHRFVCMILFVYKDHSNEPHASHVSGCTPTEHVCTTASDHMHRFVHRPIGLVDARYLACSSWPENNKMDISHVHSTDRFRPAGRCSIITAISWYQVVVKGGVVPGCVKKVRCTRSFTDRFRSAGRCSSSGL